MEINLNNHKSMGNLLKIASVQLNFIVGDIEANCQKILKAYKTAGDEGADLVVFSELSVTGYPPEDLVLRRSFRIEAIDAVRNLAKETKSGPAMIVGGLWLESDRLYNAAFLLDEGQICSISCKRDLPNYGVFDEKRLFSSSPELKPVDFKGNKLGVLICEDMWNPQNAKSLKDQGAEILIVINASPFEMEKQDLRINLAVENTVKTKLPLIYVNQIGGQDELVFDGSGFVLSANGEIAATQVKWRQSMLTTCWEKTSKGKLKVSDAKSQEIIIDDESTFKPFFFEDSCLEAIIYNALILGLHDYVYKNGFPGVVIGFSGGIDSALSAAVAVDALGADKVHLVMMPSVYTSEESLNDAAKSTKMLGIKLETISIESEVASFGKSLKDNFKGKKADITEENIQSRIRGVILMAISNKHGYMVLTTGNKSEMAVGYATLYGDMCGGYNVLKDIYKVEVFKLAKWRNKQGKVIAKNIISKPPTAELRPNQKDQDSLPPYEVLDNILKRLIENRDSALEISQAAGIDLQLVKKVAKLVKRAEYKRYQSPLGVKITRLAFGRDRRYPITNKYNF